VTPVRRTASESVPKASSVIPGLIRERMTTVAGVLSFGT
jgi:hypothetical protein